MKTFAVFVALTAMAVVPVSAHAEGGVQCPGLIRSTIMLDEGDSIKSWDIGGKKLYSILKGGRIFVGEPNPESLRPENEVKPIPQIEKFDYIDKKKGKEITKRIFYQIWNFNKNDGRHYFLVCDYAGTEVYLMRRIDPSISRCVDISFLDNGDNQTPRVECK